MNKEDIKHFKQKLEAEKKSLEAELSTVGRRNPHNPNDWEPIYSEIDVDTADDGDVAEEINEYQNNIAILNSLELKYNEVLVALEKIIKGKYGICEVCGKPIEHDRLDANPGAKTCKAHM